VPAGSAASAFETPSGARITADEDPAVRLLQHQERDRVGRGARTPGWHLSREVMELLLELDAELDVDEYG